MPGLRPFAQWSGVPLPNGRAFVAPYYGESDSGKNSGKDTDPVIFNPGAVAAHRYVALGDSVSSGEGLPEFQPGTDVPSNMCHRSTKWAYPVRIAQAKGYPLDHHACSGAVVSDFHHPNPRYSEIAQLKWLNSDTKRVTLTVGANDASFSWVIRRCVLRKADCSEDPDVEDWVHQGITALQKGHSGYCVSGPGLPKRICYRESGSLDRLYSDIAARAPNARIIVANYPRLFVLEPKRRCDLGNVLTWIAGFPLTVKEQRWLNAQAWRLNSTIGREVAQAKRRGVNVRVANVSAAFGDHGLCSSRPWIIGLRTRGLDISPFSLHPTIRGQSAIADAIVKHF
jgi:hypothetical protein